MSEKVVYLPWGSESLCYWCTKWEKCRGSTYFAAFLSLNASQVTGCKEFTPNLPKIKKQFGTILVRLREHIK